MRWMDQRKRVAPELAAHAPVDSWGAVALWTAADALDAHRGVAAPVSHAANKLLSYTVPPTPCSPA